MTTGRTAPNKNGKAKNSYDLKLLGLFVKVAETGTIAGGAREFRISSSFANRRILSLSKRFGADLFVRVGRRLELTEAGKLCLTWAQECLASHNRLRDDLDAIANDPSGKVRFACYTPAVGTYLFRALELFNDRYPEITVEVTVSDRPIRLIIEGYDIAIHAGPMPEGNFVTKLVQRFDRLLCASPEYIARSGQPAAPRDLQNHKCLVHSQNESSDWYFRTASGRREKIAIKSCIESNSYLLLRDLAVRGLGIVRIGENLVKTHLKDGSLLRLLPTHQCVSSVGEDFSARLIYPGHDVPHRVRVFEQHLFAAMKDHWKKLKATSRRNSSVSR